MAIDWAVSGWSASDYDRAMSSPDPSVDSRREGNSVSTSTSPGGNRPQNKRGDKQDEPQWRGHIIDQLAENDRVMGSFGGDGTGQYVELNNGRIGYTGPMGDDYDYAASLLAAKEEQEESFAGSLTGRGLGYSSEIETDPSTMRAKHKTSYNIFDSSFLGIVLSIFNPFLGAAFALQKAVRSGRPLGAGAALLSAVPGAGQPLASALSMETLDGKSIDSMFGTKTGTSLLSKTSQNKKTGGNSNERDTHSLPGNDSGLETIGVQSEAKDASKSLSDAATPSIGAVTPSNTQSQFLLRKPTIGRPLFFGVER